MLAPDRLHKIHNEEEYESALKQIEGLWNARPGTPQYDLLEVLVILVETYEKETVKILPPNPVEAIKFRMEQGGLTSKDLRPILGPRSRVEEILQGTRRLTLPIIRNLHAKLGIPLESLVG